MLLYIFYLMEIRINYLLSMSFKSSSISSSDKGSDWSREKVQFSTKTLPIPITKKKLAIEIRGPLIISNFLQKRNSKIVIIYEIVEIRKDNFLIFRLFILSLHSIIKNDN